MGKAAAATKEAKALHEKAAKAMKEAYDDAKEKGGKHAEKLEDALSDAKKAAEKQLHDTKDASKTVEAEVKDAEATFALFPKVEGPLSNTVVLFGGLSCLMIMSIGCAAFAIRTFKNTQRSSQSERDV